MRAVRELVGTPGVERVLLRSRRSARVGAAVESFGDRVAPWPADGRGQPTPHVVVVAGAPGTHAASAAAHHAAGSSVVSTSDDPDDVRALFDLEGTPSVARVGVTVAAAFSPGLSSLLARHAADLLAEVDLVRVAMAGAGGPECERRRVEARSGIEPTWRDGRWASAEGSAPELVWFPDPVGALDATRGALVEALVLHRALPDVPTITAASVPPTSATRVTSLANRLAPRGRGLTPPEPLGAVRVEVSGRRADGSETMVVYAVVDRPAVAAGAMAAVAATGPEATQPGVRVLGRPGEALPMLRELARRGVKAATFEPSV
jgi:hypothetical protein